MRKIICLLVLITAHYLVSAQCEKRYKLKTERIVTINSDGSEGEEMPFTADISISKDSIRIVATLPDGNIAEIKGKHTETVCKMNADYTEGTIEYKTEAEMSRTGETRPMRMVFTMEAKDGKLKLFGVPEEQGEKICFFIKEKEEVK